MSVFSESSFAPDVKPSAPREVKLKIFVALLFCVIVVAVIVIYQFYSRSLYLLELGQRIYVDEIDRTISVTDEDNKEVRSANRFRHHPIVMFTWFYMKFVLFVALKAYFMAKFIIWFTQ